MRNRFSHDIAFSLFLMIRLYYHLPKKESEPCHEKTNILVSNLIRLFQAVQLQKMARGLKFLIKKVEGLPYLGSENKALISFVVTAKLICVFVFAYMQDVGFLMTRLILY